MQGIANLGRQHVAWKRPSLPTKEPGVPTAAPLVLGALLSAACAMPKVKARKRALAIRVTFVLMGRFLTQVFILHTTNPHPSKWLHGAGPSRLGGLGL